MAFFDFAEADAFGLVVEEFDFVEDDAHGVYEGAGEDDGGVWVLSVSALFFHAFEWDVRVVEF